MTTLSSANEQATHLTNEGACLLRLLAKLDNAGFAWCLVGDTRGYPHTIRGDVDIVVEPAALPRLEEILIPFCRNHGARLVQLLEHEQTARYFVLAWFSPDGRLRFLRLDFCSDYLRRGQPYLKADEILRNRFTARSESGEAKGFHVAAPAMEFIYYLLKKTEKQMLLPDHEVHLSTHWQQDPAGARKQIERFWPAAEAELITGAAASNDWSRIRNRLPELRRRLRQKLRFSPAAWLREVMRKTRRFLRPTGLMVAVLGPDGSGKSTVLAQCSKELLPAFRRVQVFHLRPRLGSTASPGSTPNTNPHGQPPRGGIASIAKLAFLWVDYTLGYWFKVRPLLVCSTLVFFDRYYHDLLVDPRRYRFASPMWLARLVGHLIPKPDLWLLLDALPEVLQPRKQEVPLAETTRQVESFRELIGDLPNSCTINAAATIGEVVGECGSAVLERMALRLASRLDLPHDPSCSTKGPDEITLDPP